MDNGIDNKKVEELQKEKLTLEIKRLKWNWLKGSSLVGWLTLVLGLCSALALYGTGYFDVERGGYLSVSEGDDYSILSLKEDHDGAEPAPGSVAALNLVRLSRLTGKAEWSARAGQVLDGALSILQEQPVALPHCEARCRLMWHKLRRPTGRTKRCTVRKGSRSSS